MKPSTGNPRVSPGESANRQPWDAGRSRGQMVCVGLRGCAVLAVIAWLVVSIASGGLCRAACNVWHGVHPHKRVRGWPPDARNQWWGPYYDAVDVLQKAGLSRDTTVAVVLGGGERPRVGHPPKYAYETFYRLYPLTPDLYLPIEAGGHAPYWYVSYVSMIPAIPKLWEHDWVLWADTERWPRPQGYRMIYANPDARLYRRVEQGSP